MDLPMKSNLVASNSGTAMEQKMALAQSESMNSPTKSTIQLPEQRHHHQYTTKSIQLLAVHFLAN
jgi:hypothetical protein